MASNKVRFGLSNVHYAKLDTSTDKYATPVGVPGAVSLEISYDSDTSTFRADNSDYETFINSSTISGTLTVAAAPDSMFTDLLGYVDDDGVLLENMSAQPSPFAMLFEISGNLNDQRFCLYNCKLSRPTQSANTTDTSITPDTQQYTFTASAKAFTVDGTSINVSKASVENTTDNKAKYDAWMTTVYIPGATA